MKTKTPGKETKAFLRKELEEYLESAGSMSWDEKAELLEWAASGHSVHDNPYMLHDDSGCPMDFLTGLRIGSDMPESPSGYSWGAPEEPGGDCLVPF